MATNWRKWGGLIAFGLGLLFLGIFVRDRLGIDLEPQSIRAWILDTGPVAPILCVGIVALRSFIGLPSQLVLIVAGLSFGVFWGTVYGTIGLELSGLITFQLARIAGRDAVHRKIPERMRPLIARAGERPGALFIAVATAYPIGVLTAYHGLAGVTSMKLRVFAFALALGAVVRAATYAYFGNSLVAGDLELMFIATAIILGLLALPLLFPSGRAFFRRVFLGKELTGSQGGAADPRPGGLSPRSTAAEED
ncbi:MAG: VTT domain-containing protein [Myxococcota bacterium]|nr:VTT domain-containing protein [Myxococcota bacterium]